MNLDKEDVLLDEKGKIYSQIPCSRCKDGCFRCCTNMIQTTPSELKAMGGYEYNGVCSHLKDGKCSVYEHRPFVCRIFGTSEILKCDDCSPERFLSEKETMDLIRKYTLMRKREEAAEIPEKTTDSPAQ